MRTTRSSIGWPVATIIVGLLAFFVALPDSMKPWAPSLLKPHLHLGLDLAGGTQLDFRISEYEISEREKNLQSAIEAQKKAGNEKEVRDLQGELQNVQQQHEKIVEAIRSVLERRINSLGVSEATITPSYFGNEKHLFVECPGVVDVDNCIKTVGKTIQLEFKEEYTEIPKDYEQGVRAKADAIFSSIKDGTGSLQVIGQSMSTTLGISYIDSKALFQNELPSGLEEIWKKKKSDPVFKIEGTTQTIAQNAQGQQELREVRGIYIGQVLEDKKPIARPLTDPSQAMREIKNQRPDVQFSHAESMNLQNAPSKLQAELGKMPIGSKSVIANGTGSSMLYLSSRVEGTEEMKASHILIAFKGATRADASITRTKEQAKMKAQQLKKELDAGADFKTIASRESDGESKAVSGNLGIIQKGMLDENSEKAAFALAQNAISDPIETPYGYRIFRADTAAHVSPTKVTYDLLTFNGANAEKTAKKMMQDIDEKKIVKTEDQMTFRFLYLSLQPTGWKDTALNGQRFRSAAAATDPVTNVPVVQIQFDSEGAKLFQELTKKNIGKRIAVFVGGEMVTAPTVNAEIAGGNAIITGSRNLEEAQKLAQDLNTGAIPAPIYLSGQTTIEATLGSAALSQSIKAGIVGLMLLACFLLLIYRMLGVMACMALFFYVVLLIAATKLPILLFTQEYVVLTLAGIAGIILSMGMAVDANILAFERIKEEMKKGKLLRTAIETGFKRAWPSIRDGNTSTLITCGILFVIGTSIIRGFAVTLSIGIFLSLFTAIVVTRWLCRILAQSALASRPELFGVKAEERKKE